MGICFSFRRAARIERGVWPSGHINGSIIVNFARPPEHLKRDTEGGKLTLKILLDLHAKSSSSTYNYEGFCYLEILLYVHAKSSNLLPYLLSVMEGFVILISSFRPFLRSISWKAIAILFHLMQRC
jgi:hypothetical protein